MSGACSGPGNDHTWPRFDTQAGGVQGVKCELPQFALGPVCELLYFYQHSFVAASPDLFDVIVGDHLKTKASPLDLDESGANLNA